MSNYNESNYEQTYPTYPNTNHQNGVLIPQTKDWIIWLVLMMIPIVNFVLLIVWALDSDPRNVVRRNFCRANIIVGLIAILLTIIILVLFYGLLFTMMDDTSYSSIFANLF